ncbi:legumain-like [Salminus brasiliensis]|uniref:legumain-like n=1 Tax=Salminus brasiliensis TaxID=930266 RepID=UPI003B830F8E
MRVTQSKQWVLLAAGSMGWNNYRHQADVCHAYQMVHHNGIPDEQIAVMMYDDIAYNAENPNPGEIINVPGGPNVYPGVLKDYTRLDVSARNFLAVLRGDEAGVNKQGGGPKKVLKSGKNDTIFIFLSDHGAQGLFAFPSDRLYASDLLDTINKMSNRQQFSKMVIYIESCFSGSMIEHLPKNIQVYGVSASNPDEPHHACFKKRGKTYLAGEFSSWWLRHCEKVDLTQTTFQDQFEYVTGKMSGSTPCQYGNMALRKLFISDFLGSSDVRARRRPADLTAGASVPFMLTHLTPSHDVPLLMYKERIESENDPEKKEALQQDYKKLRKTRADIKKTMHKIAERSWPEQGLRALNERRPLTRLHDMKDVAEHFRMTFTEWHEQDDGYILSHMHVFVNLFESGVEVARIKQVITSVRSSQRF